MALMADELFEAQLIRAMAYASSGGAELGEMLGTAERITRLAHFRGVFGLGRALVLVRAVSVGCSGH